MAESWADEYAKTWEAQREKLPTAFLSRRIADYQEFGKKTGWPDWNSQDVHSLTCLWLLAAWFRPEVVIEIGTGWGASLSVWCMQESADVHAVDRDFTGWKDMQAFRRTLTPRLTLHEGSASLPDYARIVAGRRTIFWLDAHDEPQEKVFVPAIVNKVFPVLRTVPHVFAMHDVSAATARDLPQGENTGPLLAWDGRYWDGFPEVLPFVQWVNRTRAVVHKPDDILRRRGADMGSTSIVFLEVPRD